jgi:hypothetical protein
VRENAAALGHAIGAEKVDGEVSFEHGAIAQVVVKCHAGVVNEDVERFHAIDRRLDLRRAGHVERDRRDARVRMDEGPAGAGENSLRASAECFLDQRLTDTAIGA